uniref:ATP synthase complex subunit 8 n=1 Tax=Chaoborus flavicans TaxID=204564 RepID=I0AYR7_9DIPT|nr:ATP synthase F0 subunit 8 [Chaoborus flavicans]
MPQMAPMNWLILFIFFLFIFILFNIFNFFIFTPLKNFKMTQNNHKTSSLTWKW